MEQKHDQTPPEEDGASGAGSEVSMDEILTSLRSILEEDQGSGSQPQTGTQSSPPEEGPGEDDEDELVLTDVVEEGPGSPETAGGETPGSRDAAHFDTLFSRGDSLDPGSTQASPGSSPDESEPSAEPEEGPAGVETPFQMASGEAEEPEPLEWGSPFPEEEGESEAVSEAGEEPGALELDWEAEEEPASPEAPSSPILGQPEEPEWTDPEAEAEPATTGEGPSAETGSEGTAAGPVDTERLREVVNGTVEEQVAQATRELDTRLAEALEPKIREVLQGFLEERLPALLQELAEAEIERIKRGE